MSNRRTTIIVFVLVLISLAVSAAVYPRLPESVASHWNSQGEVNGYMNRLQGAFFLPLLVAVLSVFLLYVPKIDPLKANIAQFRPIYNRFIIFFAVFMLYLHIVTLAINLGYRLQINQMLIPALGIFFFLMGDLIAHAKRNYFIGIRTPWTLQSDTVWQKTHERGSVLFKAAGILAVLGIFVPKYAAWFLFVPLMAAALYTVIYSYFVYQRENAGS